ncbi:hydrolase Nlp/P60 [Pseudomonas phage phiPMW]|uniref:Hydrolase Nlp/P60 n=1 Tax=Pseudomonas phage phiPMW TaxID=1815582 RepID=A0A1S5R1I4_9CAUD|nr:minor tail protein [Pseudomonas phage phiPMW]ANA49266.1 hydrolase Nlp/P60 [Pseudomonas phage phiPMW]
MIPKKLKAKTIKAIKKHAEQGYPNEVCGVVVMTSTGEQYVECVNLSSDPTQEFQMCPESYVKAEELGEVVGIVHSHPDGTSYPSDTDLAVMNNSYEIQLMVDPTSKPIPWHIVSWPEGDYQQVLPEDIGLIGKDFIHGLNDCWAACEAYYRKYHNLEFPRYEREDLWWENANSTSLYEKNFKEAGFYAVEDYKPGDMIVMQIGKSHFPNHAGIYLGETKEFEGREFYASPLMYHHMYNRKSEVVVYGGQWLQRTRLILRHKGVKHGNVD